MAAPSSIPGRSNDRLAGELILPNCDFFVSHLYPIVQYIMASPFLMGAWLSLCPRPAASKVAAGFTCQTGSSSSQTQKTVAVDQVGGY